MWRLQTRIPGLSVVRATTRRRSDGSTVSTQRPLHRQPFSNAQVIEASADFTAQPTFATVPGSERMVRCVDGEVFVVVADVRLGSPSFGQWQSFHLREGDQRSLEVGSGLAVGWQVLSASAALEICSQFTVEQRCWKPLRFDDESLCIDWPSTPQELATQARRPRYLARIADRHLPVFKQYQAEKRPTPMPKHVRAPQKPAAQPHSNSPAKPPELPKPRILVIGGSGALGRDLCRALKPHGQIVRGCRSVEDMSYDLPAPVRIDMARPASIREALQSVRPSLVVNAAALTNLLTCEQQPRLALAVNARACEVLAEEAKRLGAAVIHFCSSSVFSGEGDVPWKEIDRPDPLSQFARSKLLGTQAIASSGVPHLVFRCGWLYSPYHNGFVQQIMEQATYRSTVQAEDDYFGTPTSTAWLSEQVAKIVFNASESPKMSWLESMRENAGTYHLAPLGYASRQQVADQVLAVCNTLGIPCSVRRITPCSIRDYKVPTPANSRLDCRKAALHFGIKPLRWQDDLDHKIREYAEYSLQPRRLSA